MTRSRCLVTATGTNSGTRGRRRRGAAAGSQEIADAVVEEQALFDFSVVEEKTAANLTVLQPTEGQPTRYVYDFGQEFAGVVRLSLPAALPAGVNVTIKHAEALSHPPIGPRDGSAFMGKT